MTSNRVFDTQAHRGAEGPALPQVVAALPFALAISTSLWLFALALVLVQYYRG
ncbi:MAG: hypothetical protein ABW169_07165 [Sphingobium sp.]